MTANGKTVFERKISKSRCKDAGMAFTLIFVILSLYYKNFLFAEIALGALLLDMIWPGAYLYFAMFWYKLAEVLGSITSRIILTIVFISLVTPVALLRRLAGKDRLNLKAFKKDSSSVMVKRGHLYVKKDIEQPF